MSIKKIIVVGAGPAGMMAAIRAGQLGRGAALIEKNSSCGRKLLLSGKGRCNLTNTCGIDSFIKRFSGNGQFLRDAFQKFFNRDLIDFFESRGLKLKVERQLRVFPADNSSGSILRVLMNELQKNKVEIAYDTSMKDILVEQARVKGLVVSGGNMLCADRLILACGGASFPFTGSTGDGIKAASSLGHRVVHLRPGLVPLQTKQSYPRRLEGLTLKNIRLRFCAGKQEVMSDVGELLFTESGISGPLVLSHSGIIVDWLGAGRDAYVEIDFKPALTQEQLKARLIRDFDSNPKRSARNALKALLPLRAVDVFIEASGIGADKKVNQLSRPERQRLVSLLKAFRLDIGRAMPIDRAMVTRGGVSLKDINPRTMESRIIKGLYFAGEMIDVDADTGGFNLQAAFSTGYLAGESAALS